ncbi:MAG: AraC-like DNA-binding protein [Candidatus Latescibacterota bacterium]|jgi:AraC-like DNA-binding protein
MFTLLCIVASYGATSNFETPVDAEGLIDLKETPEVYKQLALKYAATNESELAVENIINYVSVTADLSIINDHVFDNIQNSEAYVELKERYEPVFTPMSLLYLYAGFLGFYIFLVLNTRRGVDRISTLFIGLFILFHSLFILHLSLYVINYQYRLPHALFASTTFSFLYGPLLYFYFKRIIHSYKMRWRDALHMIPSIVLLLYILPYYNMTGLEKFNVMFGQLGWLLPGANVIIIGKILSLSVYGFLVYDIYRKNTPKLNAMNKMVVLWQRNIIAIFAVYTLSYVLYAGSITGLIAYPPLLHIQIIVMVSLVFYVAYISYAQPEIFRGKVSIIDPSGLYKYKKSGLTPSFSSELKDKLVCLLDDEKIYRQSDINLEKLMHMMETTRHNASQVINEHFGLNFFELMNKYRIAEALEILEDDSNELSIIQVAYEVGFNNKVTFNKSFKKLVSQTPSQYLLSLRA